MYMYIWREIFIYIYTYIDIYIYIYIDKRHVCPSSNTNAQVVFAFVCFLFLQK